MTPVFKTTAQLTICLGHKAPGAPSLPCFSARVGSTNLTPESPALDPFAFAYQRFHATCGRDGIRILLAHAGRRSGVIRAR